MVEATQTSKTNESNIKNEIEANKGNMVKPEGYKTESEIHEMGNMPNGPTIYINGHRYQTPQVIIIERQPTLFDVLPKMIGLSVYGLIIQIIFSTWERVHRKSHNIAVFILLFFAPPTLFVYYESYKLPIVWIIFTLYIGGIIGKLFRRTANKDAMRVIYGKFKILFIMSNMGIFVGQLLTLITFYFAVDYIRYGLMIFLFFLYFGLLSREIISFLGEFMAYKTGFYEKEGIPQKASNPTLCMICTRKFDGTGRVQTMTCGHSFHEECVQGWYLLAKKSFCPYCRKKIDKELIPANFWDKTEVWFYPLLDGLRKFIVITLVITGIIMYKLRQLENN